MKKKSSEFQITATLIRQKIPKTFLNSKYISIILFFQHHLNKLTSNSIRDKLKHYPPILERKFTYLDETPRDSKTKIRVMQWNMLARALCVKGGFTRAPDETFDWSNYRLYRTLEELIRHNCDIICMEVSIKKYLKLKIKLILISGQASCLKYATKTTIIK
jgi:hypothetical protein